MAQLPRFARSGQPQHVIQRGNNRETIFGVVADYHFYLEKLQAAANKQRCEIHAYVPMTSHGHRLLTSYTENGIGKIMKALGHYHAKINQIRPY